MPEVRVLYCFAAAGSICPVMVVAKPDILMVPLNTSVKPPIHGLPTLFIDGESTSWRGIIYLFLCLE